MKSNTVIDILSPIPYLAKFCFSSYGPRYYWPIKLQDSLKFNISRRKWMMKFIFSTQINIKVFYKLILSFLSVHSQAFSKIPKIASLQCPYNISKKKLKMKLIFCTQINIKVLRKLISTLWASKFSARWFYHYWWTW